jgi:PAS domain-containing protein
MTGVEMRDLRDDEAFAALLAGRFARLVGRALAAQTDAAWLYRDAPFCLLAHDGGADPVFIYANRAAQACFGYDWDEFLRLPSRLSAEAPVRAERERLLAEVKARGFIEDYAGVRVAKCGRRLLIERAVGWELVDEMGVRHGQAAMFYAGAHLTG